MLSDALVSNGRDDDALNKDENLHEDNRCVFCNCKRHKLIMKNAKTKLMKVKQPGVDIDRRLMWCHEACKKSYETRLSREKNVPYNENPITITSSRPQACSKPSWNIVQGWFIRTPQVSGPFYIHSCSSRCIAIFTTWGANNTQNIGTENLVWNFQHAPSRPRTKNKHRPHWTLREKCVQY